MTGVGATTAATTMAAAAVAMAAPNAATTTAGTITGGTTTGAAATAAGAVSIVTTPMTAVAAATGAEVVAACGRETARRCQSRLWYVALLCCLRLPFSSVAHFATACCM